MLLLLQSQSQIYSDVLLYLHLHFAGSNVDILESNLDYLTSVFGESTKNNHRKTHNIFHCTHRALWRNLGPMKKH